MKILTAAAGLAAVLVTTGAAMAVPVQGTQSAIAAATSPRINQANSNHNLINARVRTERAIDSLSSDVEDYGGHRVTAIADLKQARAYILQALDYWRAHHRVAPGGPLSASSGSGEPAPFERNQANSNKDIRQVRTLVEKVIDGLQSDASDYGGFKGKAIDRLQAARAQLDAAVDLVGNKGVQNGSHNPAISDANLRFVQEHVEAAIARLQQDLHDYGGHRVAAVADLQQADTFISDALAYDHSHDANGRPISPIAIKSSGPMSPDISQGRSNDSLADARGYLEKAIDAFSRDAHDYNGYRGRALARMSAARSQLLLALQFERAH